MTNHTVCSYSRRLLGKGFRLGAVLVATALTLVVPGGARAQSAASKEYPIKAACLLNFAQYVEWPTEAFPEAGTPFTIGILGDDPFGEVMEATVQGETIRNRKLAILRSRKVDDLKSCHLLFISRSEKGRLDEILRSLEATNALTVSETERFASRGGVINFYLEGNKVRFEINQDAAQRHSLKISAQLLKLARIVSSEQPKGGR